MTRTRNLLPSSRVIIVILVLVAAILLVVLRIHKNDIVPVENTLLHVVAGEQGTFDRDSDTDGLKDWEEVLWQTDPYSADTDGDGTGDKEEILANRDPRVAGPDDPLTTTPAISPGSTTTPPVPLTQTDLFARAFISMYLNDKLSGGDATNTLDTLSQFAIPAPEKPTQYMLSDLTLSADTSETAIHTYGNGVGNILRDNAPGVENEIIIVLRAMDANDPTLLERLHDISDAYQTNATQLLALPVPQDVATTHLQLINTFLVVARDINLMQSLFDDSLTSIGGFTSYFDSSEKLVGTLENLGTYLNTHTTFTTDEDGYILTSTL